MPRKRGISLPLVYGGGGDRGELGHRANSEQFMYIDVRRAKEEEEAEDRRRTNYMDPTNHIEDKKHYTFETAEQYETTFNYCNNTFQALATCTNCALSQHTKDFVNGVIDTHIKNFRRSVLLYKQAAFQRRYGIDSSKRTVREREFLEANPEQTQYHVLKYPAIVPFEPDDKEREDAKIAEDTARVYVEHHLEALKDQLKSAQKGLCRIYQDLSKQPKIRKKLNKLLAHFEVEVCADECCTVQ